MWKLWMKMFVGYTWLSVLFSLSVYCFLILVLNIEVEVFNLNNLWTLLPPRKSWTYIQKWDISRIKNRENDCWAQEISWGNDSDSYNMWKLQGWIRKRKEFLWVDQGKAMRDFQEVFFLPLNFCKNFKGFCGNQISSKP